MQIQQYDREKLQMNVARLKKGGKNFEVVLENIDKALNLKSGKKENIADIIKGDLVLQDAKKGISASEHDMKELFGTSDTFKVANQIIKNGEINLTAKQRNRIYESKKRRILEYIHENSADPKTGMPHPIQRIELAMKESKINIDPMDRVEWQIEKIVPKIQAVIPLSFEKIHLRITIPAIYAGPTYSSAKSKYKLQNEIWRNDGSVQFEVKIIAGKKNDLFSIINKLSNGEAQIEEIK